MIKLMTWNLRHGGGARGMPEIAMTLLDHSADVIVLTEWRRATGGQIAGILAEHGWRHQLSTNPPPKTNGVLVASRTPLRPTVIEPLRLAADGGDGGPGIGTLARGLKRRWIEVALPELGLVLAGVHVPCDGRDSGRVAFLRSLVGAARSRAGEDYVLIGDFNAGRHRLDEEGATFSCVGFLGELATLGYADAWRTLHPEGREYTWYSHSGNGFRIDYAFVSPRLAPRLRSCWYSHQERELGLSDHSAMVVCLERAG